MYRDFQRSVPLKSALSIIVLTGMVFSQFQPCFAKRVKTPKKEIISEKPSLDLVEKLGHKPELLTPEYLQYVLGRPAKRNVSDGSNVVLHWQTNAGGIGSQDCELSQTRDANQRLIRASFKINLPRSTVTLTDIEKKIEEDRNNFADQAASRPPTYSSSSGNQPPYGAPALVPSSGRKLYDQECRPSLQYSFVPYTKVYYTQAANTFHVHRVEVDYAGPALPPPSQQDIAEVATGMRNRAIAHQVGEKNQLAVPMLHDHLAENPSDAEAHYALAQSYQKSSHLNEAIAEYQLALRYSNGNNVVASNAVQSLQQLHVMTSPDDRIDFHTLKFKQHGQGLTQGDVIATQDRQSFLANQAPSLTNSALSTTPGYTSGMPGAATSPGLSGSPQQAPYGLMTPGSNSMPGYNPNGRTNWAATSGGAFSGSYGMLQPPPSPGSNLTGLKAPPAGSLNLPTSPPLKNSRTSLASTDGEDLNPRNVRYTPADSATVNAVSQDARSGQQSFYNSMQYGTNLFPATAGNPNLEPGF